MLVRWIAESQYFPCMHILLPNEISRSNYVFKPASEKFVPHVANTYNTDSDTRNVVNKRLCDKTSYQNLEAWKFPT